MKEYQVVEEKIAKAEARMNQMAKDGWEVISTSIYLGGTALTRDSSVMYSTFGREV